MLSLTQCLIACESAPGCSVATYSPADQNCFLKGCPSKYAVTCPVCSFLVHLPLVPQCYDGIERTPIRSTPQMLQCYHIVAHLHMHRKVATYMITAAHSILMPSFLRKDSVSAVQCMTDTSVVQVAPNPNGQGDGLGNSAAPAPPIPPCTKEPWLCPTVHNPYYNYFSTSRCGRSPV